MDQDKLYSIFDSCEILGGISRATLYRLVSGGHLKIVKIGGRSFVRGRNMLQYIDGLEAA